MTRARATLLIGALAAFACSSEAPPAKSPIGRSKAAPPAAALPGPPGLPAALLAADNEDVPVAFAQSDTGSLAAFVQGGKLYARAVTARPEMGEAHDLGAVSQVGAFSLKAHKDGFALFWSERVDQNHIFKMLRLDPKGAPKQSVISFPPIPDTAIPYADFAPVGDRGLVLHELAHEDLASVYVTTVPAAPGEKPTTRPVVTGALAWGATQTQSGLALAVVRAPRVAAGQRVLGTIEVVLIGTDGVAKPPVPVLTEATAEIDAEIASVDGGLLVAWTDARDDAGAVRLAALDASGKPLSAPTLVAPPIGDQALVSLVAEPTGKGKNALIAWENIGQKVEGTRVLQLATVGADGKPGKQRTRLLLDADDRPDLVAHDRGFAALTLAPARQTNAEGGSAPSWPTYVGLGPDLTPTAAEPIRFLGTTSGQGVPQAAFGLTCNHGTCFVLAADIGKHHNSFVINIPERQPAWRAPAWRADDERPPKITALQTVADGARFSAIRSLRLPDGASTLTSWVTYHLDGTTAAEAAPKGESPYAATLAVRPLSSGSSFGAPVILSKRAVSSGGVAMAAVPGGKRAETVLAWVASDKGTPQVFATKVDEKGQKVAQKKVTVVERGKKGAEDKSVANLAFDVALAWSPADKSPKGETRGTDGFVVAWVDTRDGDGEVYAARINKDLEKTVVEKRITTATGDASEVSILVRGSSAFVAFAETRDNKPADIYLSHLDAITLREIDEDGRVYASAGPSRAPKLFSLGDKVVLAWIEDPAKGERTASTLRIGEIDPSGRLVGAPRVISAPDGASMTGYSINCAAGSWSSCRGVLSWAREGGHPEIGGVAFTDDLAAAPTIVRLGSLTSGPFAEPSLSLADPRGTELFFIEDIGEKGRARRVELAW
ncbi:MAG: hypothetical protein HOV80_12110 [Polyangiaceae bacterium]|nr:hypothetical protein [Polyangiaceae bacterium]